MLPQVRDLYKRLLIVGVDYPHPEGLAYARRKMKEGFRANAHLTHEADINKAVGKGRYIVRETQAFIQFKKYRAMRERYGIKEAPEPQQTQSLDVSGGASAGERAHSGSNSSSSSGSSGGGG